MFVNQQTKYFQILSLKFSIWLLFGCISHLGIYKRLVRFLEERLCCSLFKLLEEPAVCLTGHEVASSLNFLFICKT